MILHDIEDILSQYINLDEAGTVHTLVNLDEAEKGQLLTSLTSKLYDDIVNKIDEIDFGTIPLSKGDITKIENYDQMLECLTIMRQILIEYKQSTEKIDVILTSIENVKSRTPQWEKSYVLNLELPIVLYNTMVLSIVSGLSIMINTSIDFIKSPNSESVQISFDKVAYKKSSSNLLFENLEKFNNMCSRGEIDSILDNIFSSSSKGLTGGAVLGLGAVGFVAVVALAKNLIPLLQELVFFAYHAKQSVSDYFITQSDLIQANANTLQYKNLPADRKKEIYKRQTAIATRFRKLGNALAIKAKKAEIETKKDVAKSAKDKKSLNDVMDTAPAPKGSSLF